MRQEEDTPYPPRFVRIWRMMIMRNELCAVVIDRIQRSISLLYGSGFIEKEKRDQVLFELNNNLRIDISTRDNVCIIKKPELSTRNIPLSKIVLKISESNVNTDAYPMFHEIAHFLSIGEFYFDGSEYGRLWGICKTTYSIDDRGIHTHIDKRLYHLNEALNDNLGYMLYKGVVNKRVPSYLLDRISRFNSYGDCINKMYLMNNTHELLKILGPDP